MKKAVYFSLALCCAVASGPVQAQGEAAQVSRAPVARNLPASTVIKIVPVEEISSKRIEVGQQVHFVTVGDVTENGEVAIPRGSTVTGTVTYKTGKAIGGKSGKFELSFDTVSVRGQNYRLRGTHRQEGKGNTVAAVFASVLISGRSAVMLPGQEVNAFTAEQIPY